MASAETQPDILENIEKHIDQLQIWSPKQAVVGIGEYAVKILLKGSFAEKTDDVFPLFVEKSGEDIVKWSQPRSVAQSVLGLDAGVETHFWFYILRHLAKNDDFTMRLKSKPIDKLSGAVIVSSIWDGIGSALLPVVINQFKTININTAALALLPSKAQSPDAYFNAFSAIRRLTSEDLGAIVVLDRDYLEDYVGVDRKGSVIKGNIAVNYFLELLLARETVVKELSELSRSFNVRMFTILSASGASLKLHGSLENILDTALLRPLLKFDLSSASLIYAIVRVPIHFKDKLSKGKIEIKIANWFKEKANFKSVHVTEPLYVEDTSDRVDVVLLVGGFDLTELLGAMEKRMKALKTDAIERGLMSKEEWQGKFKSSEKE